MTRKDDLHRLIDDLPEGELPTSGDVLRDLLGLLNTPEGEEPLSWPQIIRLLEAKQDAREGRVERFSNSNDAIRWLHNQAGRSE